MPDTAHTLTWKLTNSQQHDDEGHYYSLYNPVSGFSAKIYENKEKASLIVKALNCHAELVASVEEMIKLFDYEPYSKSQFENGECPILDRAKAALAKAGVK